MCSGCQLLLQAVAWPGSLQTWYQISAFFLCGLWLLGQNKPKTTTSRGFWGKACEGGQRRFLETKSAKCLAWWLKIFIADFESAISKNKTSWSCISLLAHTSKNVLNLAHLPWNSVSTVLSNICCRKDAAPPWITSCLPPWRRALGALAAPHAWRKGREEDSFGSSLLDCLGCLLPGGRSHS